MNKTNIKKVIYAVICSIGIYMLYPYTMQVSPMLLDSAKEKASESKEVQILLNSALEDDILTLSEYSDINDVYIVESIIEIQSQITDLKTKK